MHAKLINPKANGKKAYNNQGSAAQALNYLTHEARQNGQEAHFFDGQREALDRESVLAALQLSSSSTASGFSSSISSSSASASSSSSSARASASLVRSCSDFMRRSI